jgi:hypothetical protein
MYGCMGMMGIMELMTVNPKVGADVPRLLVAAGTYTSTVYGEGPHKRRCCVASTRFAHGSHVVEFRPTEKGPWPPKLQLVYCTETKTARQYHVKQPRA